MVESTEESAAGRRGIAAEDVVRGKRRSVVEGVFFAAMVGLGETFFLADAIRLSATRLEQGLVIALPLFFGAFGPLLGLAALTRLRVRRRIVAAACFGQAVVLAGLSAAAGSDGSSATLLILAAVVYGVFGQAAGTAWTSWFGDLVPGHERGRYFARRNRWIHGTTFAALLAGGAILDALQPSAAVQESAGGEGGGIGFAVVYGLAALSRVGSAVLHLMTPEPRFTGLATPRRAVRYLRTRDGRGVLRLVLTSATFYLAVYLSSPYYTPFMLEELEFTYLEYTIAASAIVIAKIGFLPVWGGVVDGQGPRSLWMLAALIIGIVPLPYLWAQGLGLIMVGQALSGMGWAAYELSLFTLILDRTHRSIRPQVVAIQSALTGAAQLAGTLLGALLLAVTWVDLRVLFAISMGARVAVALALPTLARAGRGEPTVARRREVVLRVIGYRPSGGLALRPVDPADD